VTDQDKINFYNKIYQALNPNGIFLNADVVLASNSHLQDQYMQKWIDYLTRSCTKEEIDKCLANYKKEDSPATLMNHIKWLEKIGFQDVDIIWKYYNFAVYGGRK
jgi:tRNA (cmo5U34)-methyltransferase